jgi:hypothetical protein
MRDSIFTIMALLSAATAAMGLSDPPGMGSLKGQSQPGRGRPIYALLRLSIAARGL